MSNNENDLKVLWEGNGKDIDTASTNHKYNYRLVEHKTNGTKYLQCYRGNNWWCDSDVYFSRSFQFQQAIKLAEKANSPSLRSRLEVLEAKNKEIQELEQRLIALRLEVDRLALTNEEIVSEGLRKEHGIEDFDLANRIYESACDVSDACAVTIQYAYAMIAPNFKKCLNGTGKQ